MLEAYSQLDKFISEQTPSKKEVLLPVVYVLEYKLHSAVYTFTKLTSGFQATTSDQYKM